MSETHDPPAEVFKHEAMATWFQLHITGEEPSFARAAAVEAFRLLDRLETLLSRYQEDSEIAAISRLQAGESFIADPEVFNCLALALTLSEQTSGAFDPALGAAADQRRGLTVSGNERGRLILEAVANRVSCENNSVPLDLGAIGKGYALDRMEELLKDWGVGNALLVGGGSSVKTLAADPHAAPCWSCGLPDGSTLWLKNCALGCSGTAVQGEHIINPRTGLPADGHVRVWVTAPTAAAADAFSTAFMILPAEEMAAISACENLAVAWQPKNTLTVNWLAEPQEHIHGAYWKPLGKYTKIT